MIGLGYVIGSCVMAAVLGLLLKSEGFGILPALPTRSPEWKSFLESYIFSSFAYGALAAVLFANQAFAGSLSATDIAAFGFGTKLVTLALAFLATIANSLLMQYFTNLTVQHDHSKVWSAAKQLIIGAFGLATLATLVWIAIAHWIVGLVYSRGQFTASDAKLVVSVQRIFVMQAPFFVVGIVCWRILNSIGSWKSLLFASVAALIFDLLAAMSLRVPHGAPGIAGAHALAIMVWAAILLFCLRTRLKGPNSAAAISRMKKMAIISAEPELNWCFVAAAAVFLNAVAAVVNFQLHATLGSNRGCCTHRHCLERWNG